MGRNVTDSLSVAAKIQEHPDDKLKIIEETMTSYHSEMAISNIVECSAQEFIEKLEIEEVEFNKETEFIME